MYQNSPINVRPSIVFSPKLTLTGLIMGIVKFDGTLEPRLRCRRSPVFEFGDGGFKVHFTIIEPLDYT